MYRLTASDCQDGPCPLIAIDEPRGMTALQGYSLPADSQDDLAPIPPGEKRIEMTSDLFELLLARHLTEAALNRILALRG